MGRKKIILVVDDNEDILRSIRDILEAEEFSVVTVSDGSEGLTAVQEHQPDLVITDVIMPDMEGLELIQSLRKIDEHLPIIVMSGNPVGVKFFNAAGIFGAKANLLKPFSHSDLINAVHSVLDNKTTQ